MSMPLVAAAIGRLLLFSLLWWALSEGDLEGWLFMLLAAALATAFSLALVPPGTLSLRPLALLAFVPFFLRQSFLGGLDVARRAMSPRLPLALGFVDYPLALRGEAARAFFVWVVSLLPGTAGAELLEGTLKVHLLDTSQEAEVKLRELERKVARLFDEARAL